MKCLVFLDVHEDRKALRDLIKRARRPDIDFIVCGGDISQFGRGLVYALKEFNEVGKKVYVIPGNHEEGRLDEKLVNYPNWINFHRKAVEIGDYVFLGYGGNGFSAEDAEFRKIARKWYGNYNGRKIVLVTHGPPLGTKLDLLGRKHVGNIDFRRFIERIKPKLVISGHLHENNGVMDTIGTVKVINPGWEGMVVELN